jgi:hypothetical protein
MYVTLAVRLNTQVMTADDRFTRALAAHPMMAVHVRPIEDFAE